MVVKFIQRYTSRLFQPRLPKPSELHRRRPIHFLRAHQKLLITLGVILFIISLGGRILEGALFEAKLSQGVIGLYHLQNPPQMVLNLISKPLISQDKAGKPIPNIVTSWQVNNDATLYSFHLKEGVFWSDQTKLKSADIEVKLAGAEVTYPDEQTIQIKLNEPFSALPSLLTNPVLKKGTLIGLGPYSVVDTKQNHSILTQLTLKPLRPDDNLPLLTLNFYPDEKTARVAYELGQIDSILGLLDEREYLNTNHTKVVYFSSLNKLTAIFYNFKDPLISDKNLRKTLNSATPQLENTERAKTIYPPSSWVFNEALKDPINNLAQAKDFFTKVQNGKTSQVTLTTTPDLEVVGQQIVKQWKEAGVNAILRIESGIPQNFQALLLTQPIPLDPDQYSLWHSTQTLTNISKYSSQRADKDLEDGRRINDQKERRESYLDLQKVIMDDVPITSLYFAKTNVIYRKRVDSIIQQVLSLQFPG